MNYTLKPGQKGSLGTSGSCDRVPGAAIFSRHQRPAWLAAEALGGLFRGCRSELTSACLAGTDFAKMLEAENPSRVAIGKLDLNRVIPHRVRALGCDARLIHWKDR